MTARDLRKHQLNRGRASLNRRHRRLMKALQVLFECQVIAVSEFQKKRKRLDKLRRDWLKENLPREKRMPAGRPKVSKERTDGQVCKKLGCMNVAAHGQAYCSREHAPYGWMRGEDA